MGHIASCVLWLGFLVRWAEGCIQQWLGLQITFPAHAELENWLKGLKALCG